MKKRFRFLKIGVCAGCLLLASCETDTGERLPELPAPATVSTEYLPGVIRVKFKEEPEQIDSRTTSKGAILACGFPAVDVAAFEIGAYRMNRVFRHSPRFEERTRKAGLHLWYDISFDTCCTNSRAIESYRALPEVEYAEQIPLVIPAQLGKAVEISRPEISTRAETPFNDPFLWMQWHYNCTDMLSDLQPGADINLFEAWKITTGSPDVIVSVVDGGVDVRHEDLSGNIWINEAELAGQAGIDDDRNGFIDDLYGWNFVTNSPVIGPTDHGTHVAGIISAVNGNRKGVCGIAGGDAQQGGSRIMVSQILQVDESSKKEKWAQNIPEAIKYGADNGAIISQNSWMFETVNSGTSHAVTEAINYFIVYAGVDEQDVQTGPMRGGVVIFAAGNQGKAELPVPVNHPSVMSVAAINWDYQRSSYSNYHASVALSAPGGSGMQGIYSTLQNNRYGYMEGTSMAAPHVSGVAALVVARHGGPGFTADRLRSRLIYAPHEIDSYNPRYAGRLGKGLIDAVSALKSDAKIAPVPVGNLKIEFDVQTRSAFASWTVPTDEDDRVPARCILYWSTKSFDGVHWDVPSGADGMISVDTQKQEPGEQVSAVAGELQVNTRYYFTVVAVDRWGNRSEYEIRTGSIESENLPPVLSAAIEDRIVCFRDGLQEIGLNACFADPNGDLLKYQAKLSGEDGTVVNLRISGTVLSLIPHRVGVDTVTVRATDPGGYWKETTFRVMVRNTLSDPEIFPNPVPEKLTLSMGDLYSGKVRFRIYRMNGDLVRDGECIVEPFGSARIDVSVLPGGIYLLALDTGKQKYNLKFVKM